MRVDAAVWVTAIVLVTVTIVRPTLSPAA